MGKQCDVLKGGGSVQPPCPQLFEPPQMRSPDGAAQFVYPDASIVLGASLVPPSPPSAGVIVPPQAARRRERESIRRIAHGQRLRKFRTDVEYALGRTAS